MKLSIQSVLNQDSDDWCLVIVDDNYPGEEIEKYIEDLSHPRISYIRNKENLGANANYRKALEYVQTSYFVMFGADDLMKSKYVSTLNQLILHHPDVSIFQPGVEVINGNGELESRLLDKLKKLLTPKDGVYEGSMIASRLMLGNFTYFPSITWRTEDVRMCEFRKDYHITQDLALLCDLLLGGKKMSISSSLTFQYRRHLGSDSSLKTLTGDRFKEEIELSSSLARQFLKIKWYRALIAAKIRPTNRLHMIILLPKVAKKPHIFLKTLYHIFSF